MGWVNNTSLALYTTIESFQCINIQKGPPFKLSHIFSSFNLVRGAYRQACIRYRGSTKKPMYMMTCTYDFRWRHTYVNMTIASGKYIFGPEGQYISFPHSLSKKYFFPKVRLVSFFSSARPFQRANKRLEFVSKCLRFKLVFQKWPIP